MFTKPINAVYNISEYDIRSGENPVQVIPRRHFITNTLRIAKDPVLFLGKLAQNYGPVVSTSFVGKKYFVLQHPYYIKHVLVDNQKAYFKPGATKLLRLFLGEGLSTSNGALWLKQRRIIQPAFHRQRLTHFLDIINEETTSFINRLNTLPCKTTVNITHEFLQLTISIISRAMFGTTLKDEMTEMVSVLESLARSASVWMKSIIKIPTHWPTRANLEFKNNCKFFDDVIYRIISERRKQLKEAVSLTHPNLLDMLIGYYDEETKDRISEKQLRDEMTTMFMAGHETTAQTLSWIFYHLASQKHFQQAVKHEAKEVLSQRLPAFDDLPQLIYTKQVINEALRFYPPIWAIVRKPHYDGEINGVKIPASSNILVNIYGMHHHPHYWSTPEFFNPAHFDPVALEQRPQFVYLPFGGGSRLCLGNNFATMVMQVVVSRLSQCFEFEVPAGHVPKIEPNITLRAKGGIHLLINKTVKNA